MEDHFTQTLLPLLSHTAAPDSRVLPLATPHFLSSSLFTFSLSTQTLLLSLGAYL
jgi:hypothetical protein